MKYETRLVLYAPLVIAMAVLMALSRISTARVSRGMVNVGNIQFLPLRMTPSRTVTKSEVT